MGDDEIATKAKGMFNDMMTIESHFENVGYRGDTVILGIKELAEFIRFYQPASLAPVDVDAGLRALDYQRDLALIFMVAKGSKDYDETIGDRIERVQELILQLKKQNDHLAARGCFWGWQPIETAPKDGTWIMVYWPTMGIGQYPFVVFWDEGWQPARYSDRDYGEAFPTHWMPLPAAPKKEE